jgi:hypothetical protein
LKLDTTVAGLREEPRMEAALSVGEAKRRWAMKRLAILTMAMAFSATAANAQITTPFGPPQQVSPFGVDPIVRVTSTFRVAVTNEPTVPITDPKAQETARRTLYGMAESECGILSEVSRLSVGWAAF